jgi:putative transposase
MFYLWYTFTIVKLTLQLKLLPTSEQADALKRTLETANAACDYISQVAWEARTFGKFQVQKLCYQDVRETFGLSSQMVIRALAKVCDAYKLDTETKRTFRPHAAIAYDDRILSFAIPDSSVSIWTLDKRQAIPFVCGERQRALLPFRRGESDLAFVRGNWYLFATCEIEDPDLIDVEGVLGIDLGITNIATDSDGTIYSGSTVKSIRYRHRRLRNKLQKKGTLSAKRRLRMLAGQETRFAKDVNHTISKRIVREAQRTKRAIALENLKGIRMRVRARKSQRTVLHSWSFFQLQANIVYKAALAGIPVVLIDPRNTSRTCPDCGHIAKANRRTQAAFKCVQCGCAGHADTIAAGNISVRGGAVVIQPYVSEANRLPCQRQAAGLWPVRFMTNKRPRRAARCAAHPHRGVLVTYLLDHRA